MAPRVSGRGNARRDQLLGLRVRKKRPARFLPLLVTEELLLTRCCDVASAASEQVRGCDGDHQIDR